MTNKLVVIINSLKVPKMKKILLYEMKFLVPSYSCLQNPWLGGYDLRSPFSLFSVLNWICSPHPPKKFLDTPLDCSPRVLLAIRVVTINLTNTGRIWKICEVKKWANYPPSPLSYSSTLSHNCTVFGNKLWKIKCVCILISLTRLCEIFLTLKRNTALYYHKCTPTLV